MPLDRLVAVTVVLLAASDALAHPGSGIVVAGGTIYFMDTGQGIWKVGEAGALSPVAGERGHFLTIAAKGQFGENDFAALAEGDVAIAAGAPHLVSGTSYPIATGGDGAIYYPQFRKGHVRIMRLLPGERPAEIAELPVAREIGFDGKETQAEWIWGLCAGPKGTLVYTEKDAVRRVEADGSVTAVAEHVTVPKCERPPAAKDVRLGPGLYGLAAAEDGTVYVAASACSAVLKIAPGGGPEVFLRATETWSPTGVAISGDDVYVLEYTYVETQRREDWMPRVRKVAKDGTVTVVAEVKER